MPTIKSALTLLIAIGLPAGLQTLIGPPPEKCFASSSAIYRLDTTSERPGTAVRVAGDMPHPDMTMRITDSAETADFILVDGQGEGEYEACAKSSRPQRTIRVNDDRLRPDVTVGLSNGPAADFTIFVRSSAFTVEEAAALFAVMMRANGSHSMAQR